MFRPSRKRRPGPEPRSPGRTAPPGTGLHVCPACRSPFVHPVAWHEIDGGGWSMLLRCGECEYLRVVVVSDDVAARYDDDLRSAAVAIERELARADRERLAREADAFAAALERDLIDAADFAR